MRRVKTCLVLATLAAISCGCAARNGVKGHIELPPTQRPVARGATREELLEAYNRIALGTKTLNATMELKPTAGSKYSGVIDEYHEVKAFLLAARPAVIRRDRAGAGDRNHGVRHGQRRRHISRFRSRRRTNSSLDRLAVERTSSKPIENLRPQHLLDALLWPEVRKEEAVLFEEFNDENGRYYVLTVLRGGYQTEILRKIWFDRSDLQVTRMQIFGPKGLLLSDVRLAAWQPLDSAAGPSAPVTPSNGLASFPACDSN